MNKKRIDRSHKDYGSKIPLFIGIYHFIICFLYFIFDNTVDIGGVNGFSLAAATAMFIFANPTYFLFSGYVSAAAAATAVIFLIRKRITVPLFIAEIVINTIFVIVYSRWLMIQ